MTLSRLSVVTVTLNPALDLTGALGELNLGTVNVVKAGNLRPAGKGVNVAKVLAELGADVTVTGLLGADNQESFCQLFEQLGVADEFVRVKGANRINVKLVEDSGRVSDFNFPGVAVKEDYLTAFEAKLLSLAQNYEVFVIAGSLPVGLSPERCKKWIEQLTAKGRQVFFDSSASAFAAGVNAQPWLVKPNDEELAQWAGRELNSKAELKKVAEQLAGIGIDNVVVSLGADGVMWYAKGGWLVAKPPKMNIVSTVGAGDTLVAGLCWGHINRWNREQSLSFATALSALAVTQVGVGVADIKDVERMQNRIELGTDQEMNAE